MRADAPIFVPSYLQEPQNNAIKTNEKRNQRKGRKKNKKFPYQGDDISKRDVNPDSRLIRRRKQRSTKNRWRRNRKKEEDIDILTHADDRKELIVFEEMFPSLTIENVESTKSGKTIQTGCNWSHVALDGHIKSEQTKAAELREKLELQHQMDTFTRLDVLKNSLDDVTVDAGSNDLVNNYNEEDQKVPYIKLMNMEKLRQRWIVAYEEKRKKDEEKELEMKRQKLTFSNPYEQESELMQATETHCSNTQNAVSNNSLPSVCSTQLGSKMKNIEHTSRYLESPFPLHSAVLDNDEIAILNLLSLPSDVTLRDATISVSSLYLLKNVILPKPHSRLGKTCSLVQLAVMIHRPNILRLLLSKAVNRSQENASFAQQLENLDDFKRTPLMFACEFALDGCINVLLSFGAKISTKHRTSGDTPLHIACHNGHITAATLLLKSISSRDESPSVKKKAESARLKLISNRNSLGETPMHIICKTNQIEILDLILEMCSTSSIDKALDIADENGNTPLMLAIARGAEDIVTSLSHRRHMHKLHCCPLIAAVKSKSLNMIQIIIECRSTLAIKDFDCDGALCSALQTFRGQAEALESICKILIAEGANPHAKTVLYDAATEYSHSESALTIAALQGDEEIVTLLLTCYDQYLVQKMKSLRVDPILLNQSKAYFQTIRDKYELEVQISMRDCIVRIIASEAQCSDDDFKRRLKCCVRIFRRGIALDSVSFSRILKSIQDIPSKYRIASENHFLDECIFRASYGFANKELPLHVQKQSSLYDDNVPDHDFSILLFQLNWITQEWGSMPLSCSWIQNMLYNVEQSCGIDDRDVCVLVVEDTYYRAHKSILKQKSEKLSAAISFHEMSHKIDSESNDDILTIPLDISKESFRLLIEHIYHGSIISELSHHPNTCCEQLFDLYFVAQEYICPTLAQEVEMRLLSSDPYFCSCWNCCMFTNTSNHYEHQCVYQVKGPSKLLLADNILNIISCLQDEISVDSQYEIKRIGNVGFEDIQLKPFEALHSFVFKKALTDFGAILATESFRDMCQSTIDINSSNMNSFDVRDLEDEVAIWLLQIILKEVKKMSLDVFFSTPKLGTLPTRKCRGMLS